ncbi:hypothetical protein SEA_PHRAPPUCCINO_103 [Mycobacterium phage Phrappuccino]|uniref:Uncharacterized protein n=1 Tax=Mycobacterium phage Phrappuccino TaxID=2591223 RepID=A0A514DDU8_9CAUD|nr:hypothetical protein KHQ87_gp103 [Mycobacterium phage Phrappuccino]QDH91778.1 hypothetical protein SEA_PHRAPPUCCINO_103 [Mycobacterium phage Phrappuccino]QIQ63220.1 hypothetical protein SEA_SETTECANDELA_103 [Mycobacterium phage Settecandela]
MPNDTLSVVGPENAEVLETELTLYFGATVAVTTTASGFQDWIKPSASFSTKWKGTPSGEQVVMATQQIQNDILAPMLEEIIAMCQARLTQSRRGG